MDNNMDNNSWEKWSKHVLIELDRLNKRYEELDHKLDSLQKDFIILKTRAAMYGSIAGGVIGIVTAIIGYFIR
jgi:ABC-type phosphate transport system auxiliary subunit